MGYSVSKVLIKTVKELFFRGKVNGDFDIMGISSAICSISLVEGTYTITCHFVR